jgi:aminomethyltransferase
MHKTKLYDEHVKLGGQIVPFAGWMLPVQYSSIKDEVFAVRNTCGLFDVSHMGEFFVEGKDAIEFVDSLVCNDIKSSPIGKAIYSPLLNFEGTCVDDLIVYLLAPERVLICVNASNIEKDWSWIKKVFSMKKWNAKLTNSSHDYSLLALQGPKAESIISKIIPSDYSSLPYYGVAVVNFNKTELLIARTGYTGEDGFEIFTPNQLANQLWQQLIELGAKPCGLGARDCLRIEVAYPLYGHEINEEITPIDAGLKWTVKMKKNDFVGKESLKNYNAKWKQIKFFAQKGIPREGYLIKTQSGEVLGKVTSGTLSPTINRGIGLGLIKSDAVLENELFVEIRNQMFPIEITKESFVKGGHK